MFDKIFGRTPIPSMERVLNVSSHRQKIVASNIANVMTDNYQKKVVDFNASLKKAEEDQEMTISGRRTDPRHMEMGDPISRTAIVQQEMPNSPVDVDEEMAISAENQLIYSTAVRLISGGFESLRASIRGRL